MLKIFKSVDNEHHDFKPILAEIIDKPANPLGKFIIYTLALVLATALFFLIIVEVDVFVSGRGQIVINGESKTLQPLETGTIKAINVKVGDYVTKGQVLMEIDPAENREIIASDSKNAMLLELDLRRLQALINNTFFLPEDSNNYPKELISLQKTLYISQKSSLENFVKAKELEINQVKLEIEDSQLEKLKLENEARFLQNRYAKLLKVKDIISGSELEQAKISAENKQKELEQIVQRERIYNNKISELQKGLANYKSEFKNKLLAELSEKQKELNQLKAELQSREIRTAKYQIIAPENGFVDKIEVNTIGGVVTPAQPLISLVPNKENLLVKVMVRNKDIARVKEGLPVKVKVDAYEYQKYGMLEGKIVIVSKDSYENEQKEKIYDVYVELEKGKLNYKEKTYSISSGMNVSAELEIGKRRIIELFIYPLIRNFDEGISVR